MENKYCCLCGSRFEKFLPWNGAKEDGFLDKFQVIGSDTKNFNCPVCYSHDRERHLWLYLNELNIYDNLDNNSVVMIVAPEKNISDKLYAKTKNIIAFDLEPELYTDRPFEVKKMDLTEIKLADGSADLVIANHVLEHIPNYKKALSEIYRVLKPGGKAILQTPYSPIIYYNFEDPLFNTEELREEYYGQRDHVRIFGKVLMDDIKSTGFDLNNIQHSEALNKYSSEKYGVNLRENFLLAVKSNKNKDNFSLENSPESKKSKNAWLCYQKLISENLKAAKFINRNQNDNNLSNNDLELSNRNGKIESPLHDLVNEEYYSCDYLEKGISFYYNDLIYTCYYVGYIKDKGIIGEISETGINIDELIENKRKLILASSKRNIEGCKNCPQLKKKKWRNSEEIKINDIVLNHYLLCNLKCTHCGYIENMKEVKDTETDKIITAIQKLDKAGLLEADSIFDVGEGEPSINKDMDSLISYLLDKKYAMHINSNGTKYKDIYSNGINYGLINLTLTPDAGTEESYYKIKGKNLFNTVWNNIGKYSSATNGNVVVKIILQRDNLNDGREFIDLCEKTGIKKVIVDLDLNIIENIDDEMLEALYKMVIYSNDKSMKVSIGPNWPAHLHDKYNASNNLVGLMAHEF